MLCGKRCVKNEKVTMPEFLINPCGEAFAGPYDLIEHFSEGLARAINYKNGINGYIDYTGSLVIQLQNVPTTSCAFSEGLATIKLGNMWTYINRCGEYVLDMYEFARPFKNGLAAIQKNGNWLFINKEGRMVANGFSHCLDYHEGLAIVKLNGKFGAINTDGELVIKNKYLLLDDFSEKVARAKVKTGFGFIREDGEFIIDPIYRSVESFSEDRAAVKLKTKWGFITRDNNLAISHLYDSTALGFKENLCFVRVKNNIGVIDKQGNTRVPFVLKAGLLGDCFEYYFHQGMAYAKLNSEIGAINEEGYVVERKGSSKKSVNDLTGFIDNTGMCKVPFKYNSAWRFENGLAPVFTNSGAGYVNEFGEEKIPCIYKDAQPFKNGIAIVTL